MSGYVKDPAFVRSGRFWQEAPSDLAIPAAHHSHDRAWLISILHQIETKQHGAVFEPMNLTILGVQRDRWMISYEKTFSETLESTGNENTARRVANTQLLNRVLEIKKRS